MLRFYEKSGERTRSSEELKWRRTIQFDVIDGNPFFVEIKDGQIATRKGKMKEAQFLVKGNKRTLIKLLKGRVSFTEAWVENKLALGEGIILNCNRPLDYPWLGRLIRIGQGK